MCDNTLCRIVIRQAKNSVTGPACFERKTILQVFTLQTEATAKLLMQVPRIDSGRHQHMGANSFGRLTDVGKIQAELCSGGSCSRGQAENSFGAG
jgi:hypothetical protein